MASFDYNPITGQLDLVGSGGGTSYINGVVADPTALPVTLGTPSLDSVFLAKAGSGVWLINRRPSGLYCRTANNGVAADWTYLGAFPEVNAAANWEVYGSDATKRLKFNVDGLPTATLRTVDAPAGNGQMLVEGQSIGATTRASGAFTTLNANNGTLTASAPVLDLSQTWNNAAVTFTGMRVNATNTASATASLIADFQTNGTSRASIRQDGRINCFQVVSSDSVISGLNVQAATSSFFTWSGADMLIARDAADVLAIRRTTNPQAFRIYNTNDSSSAAGTNFERGFMRWSSNVLQIGTEAAGTGSARNLELQRGGTTRITLNATGTEVRGTSFPPLDCVRGDGTGNLTEVISSFALSASYSNYANGSGPAMAFRNGSTVLARLGPRQTAAGADFVIETGVGNTERLRIIDDRVTFGGTTNAFPALKRSSTALQVRLADDSADAPLSAASITLGAGTATAPSFSASGSALGIYQRQVGELALTDGSEPQARYFANNIVFNSDFVVGWGNSTTAPTGLDTILRRDAAGIVAQYNGLNAQGYRLYNTFTSTNNFERLGIRWSSNECIIDTEIGGSGGTLRGIKIGSATSSLLGFYGATPVDRPATVADPTGGGTVDAEARTAINDIIDRLQELGLIA